MAFEGMVKGQLLREQYADGKYAVDWTKGSAGLQEENEFMRKIKVPELKEANMLSRQNNGMYRFHINGVRSSPNFIDTRAIGVTYNPERFGNYVPTHPERYDASYLLV
jgi:hypothetical protein